MSKNKKIQEQTEAVDLKFGTKIQTITTFEIMADPVEQNKLIKNTKRRYERAKNDPILQNEKFVTDYESFIREYGEVSKTRFKKLSESERAAYIRDLKELHDAPSASRKQFSAYIKQRLSDEGNYSEKDLKQIGGKLENLYDEFSKLRGVEHDTLRDLWRSLGGDVGYIYNDFYERTIEQIRKFTRENKKTLKDLERMHQKLVDTIADELSYNKVIESNPRDVFEDAMINGIDFEQSETGDIIG